MKRHINQTIKERFTVQCTKKYWIWTILGEKQKSYTWHECNTLSLPKYKADCGTLHCKFSSWGSCLDNVCQDLWHLNESLRRKLSKNASNKLQFRVFYEKNCDFFWCTCTQTEIGVCWLTTLYAVTIAIFDWLFFLQNHQRHRYKQWHLLIHNSVLE